MVYGLRLGLKHLFPWDSMPVFQPKIIPWAETGIEAYDNTINNCIHKNVKWTFKKTNIHIDTSSGSN